MGDWGGHDRTGALRLAEEVSRKADAELRADATATSGVEQDALGMICRKGN
jgi:hypothetical protein